MKCAVVAFRMKIKKRTDWENGWPDTKIMF